METPPGVDTGTGREATCKRRDAARLAHAGPERQCRAQVDGGDGPSIFGLTGQELAVLQKVCRAGRHGARLSGPDLALADEMLARGLPLAIAGPDTRGRSHVRALGFWQVLK